MRPSRRSLPFPIVVLLSVGASLVLAGTLAAVRSGRARHAGFPGARWIWISKAPERAPVRFTVLRRFSLEAPPAQSVARVFADPRFELFVNGRRAGAGGQRPGDRAASFEVARLLHRGPNTIALLAESRDGVGGILFALVDGSGRAIVTSDGHWTVDPAAGSVLTAGRDQAAVLGPPPLYPWGSSFGY